MVRPKVVRKKVRDEYVKKIVAITKRHFSKYGNRKMSLKELNNLFKLN